MANAKFLSYHYHNLFIALYGSIPSAKEIRYGIIILIFVRLSSAQWGYNPYAVGGFGIAPPPPPNTNVGVGYPTAYGLSLGRAGNGNAAPIPSPSLSSSVRCLNGGAHIGQCRLDNDAFCTALGGGCVHGACCTTPFIGLTTSATTGPEVDGEVTRKPKKHTATEPPIEARSATTVNILEIAEIHRLIENAKTTVIPNPVVLPYSRLCASGFRSVGPCSDDDDCPSLHRCEAEQCCYIV